MELQYSFSTTTLLLIILFSFLYFGVQSVVSARTLPPGPTKLPIIGNLHNLIGSSLLHRTLRDLSKKYGPLMHLKLGEVSTLIVSSPTMAREIMRTHDLSFANRPEIFVIKVSKYGNNNISFAPFGDFFRQMKKVCVMELLSQKRVHSFATIREDETRNLVETIRASSDPINLTEMFLETTSTIISRAAFGSRYDSAEASMLVSSLRAGTALAGGFSLADLYPSNPLLRLIVPSRGRLEKILAKMDTALENIIINHAADGTREETEDFVDVLLRVQKSNNLKIPITNNSIKAIIFDMFGGGTETGSTTIEWAMAEMLKNPRVMRKAQAEIREVLKRKITIHEADIQGLAYLKLVIKETLRLHPPTPLLLPRECREPCVIDGFKIPLHTRVIINGWAIGRDETSWGADAESFLPERFLDSSIDYKGTNFEFIPFGAGRRMCPGMSFGLANVEFVLSQLLFHFDWRLPGAMQPEDLDMTELFGMSIGRKHNLYVTATPFLP